MLQNHKDNNTSLMIHDIFFIHSPEIVGWHTKAICSENNVFARGHPDGFKYIDLSDGKLKHGSCHNVAHDPTLQGTPLAFIASHISTFVISLLDMKLLSTNI